MNQKEVSRRFNVLNGKILPVKTQTVSTKYKHLETVISMAIDENKNDTFRIRKTHFNGKQVLLLGSLEINKSSFVREFYISELEAIKLCTPPQ